MSRVVICDINLEMYEKYSHEKRGAALFISFMNVQIDYTSFYAAAGAACGGGAAVAPSLFMYRYIACDMDECDGECDACVEWIFRL